jgi:hypothetical protein
MIIDNKAIDKINYTALNARQKETYNFQQVSAVLAQYGFATIKLNDDWQGADFIAQHINGELFLKVQLKSRLTFSKKYMGKNLYIAFPYNGSWYIYNHDSLLKLVLERTNIGNTDSWITNGLYTIGNLSELHIEWIEEYKL